MFAFCAAVIGGLIEAASIVEAVGKMAKGGRHVMNFAANVIDRFKPKLPPNTNPEVAATQALAEIAAMPDAEFEQKADEIVNIELRDKPLEEKQAAKDYLTLMKKKVQTTFARPEDPAGKTMPAHFCVRQPEDLTTVLPTRLPKFKVGDTPPNAPSWKLIERIGIGGFGEVWKAQNKSMTRSFSVFKFCLDDNAQEILMHELENIEMVQAHLADHPNIVKLLDANFESDTPWLRFEYIEGGDLSQHLPNWPQDLAARTQMAVEKTMILVETLDHCHNDIQDNGQHKRMIHRDMKPQNVLVSKNGTLKITDFGIGNAQAIQALDEARIATASNMSVSTPSLVRHANTPMYASPQQQKGKKPHPADDVHALGVMLYQMILGDHNRPLDKDYIAVLERKHICRELISVISQMIASDQEDRYQHAGEVVAALKALPEKLIQPKVIDPNEERKYLLAKFDGFALEAKTLIRTAQDQFNNRQWKPAKETLDRIFHPILRPQELYKAVSLYADGKRMKNSIGMEFAWVPPGESWLSGGGGKPGETKFVMEEGVWCGVYLVTQGEWQAIMGDNPSKFKKGNRYPVECVSWDRITKEFLPAINKKCAADGYMYILPTEQQWEYICRGGPISKDQSKYSYYFATSNTDLTPKPTNELTTKMANFGQDGNGSTSEVGLYLPNPLGMHDMHGLLWEWTSTAEGSSRVNRGGSWNFTAEFCTAGYRNTYSPVIAYNYFGFRLLAVPLV